MFISRGDLINRIEQSRTRRTTPRAVHGFSLAELLVVIGIIAILTAMLLPAVSSARKLSQRVQCATNIRGIGAALLCYAQDYRDEIPIDYKWVTCHDYGVPQPVYTGLIVPYVGGTVGDPKIPFYQIPENGIAYTTRPIFRCPSDNGKRLRFGGRVNYSYALNRFFFTGNNHGGTRSIKLSLVKRASTKIMIADMSEYTYPGTVWGPGSGPGWSNGVKTWTPPSLQHTNVQNSQDFIAQGQTNMGFADGHVEFFPLSEVVNHRHYHPFEIKIPP
jgi:prepilin-type N-terminal cleavage/methylation domain-containing protein/prepilin-type processing-associated H-X9-DG protein